jgi:hypothetical protein
MEEWDGGMPGQSWHFLTLELEASKKNPFYRDNGDCHNLINNRICSGLGIPPSRDCLLLILLRSTYG